MKRLLFIVLLVMGQLADTSFLGAMSSSTSSTKGLGVMPTMASTSSSSAVQLLSLSYLQSSTSSSTTSISVTPVAESAVTESMSDSQEKSKEEKKRPVKRKLDDKTVAEAEADRSDKRNREDAVAEDDDESIEDESIEEKAIEALVQKIEKEIDKVKSFGPSLVKSADDFFTYDRSGFSSSKTVAMNLYKNAAAMQNIEAMKKLSTYYLSGTGVAKDVKIADQWAEKAKAAEVVEKDVCKARQCQGETGIKSWEESVRLFTASAEKGSINAIAGLGYCYLFGKGVAQDKSKGLTLLHDALEKGSVDALYWLSFCYLEGCCVARDNEKAVALLHRAITEGSAEAMGKFGRVCRDGACGCEKNIQKAVGLFKKAAALGCLLAMNDLAYCYLDGNGVDKDAQKAVQLFNQAIDAGSISALSYLGHCYQIGNGVEVNELIAGDYFARGYEGGSGNAAYHLGRCHLLGNCGFVVNASKAIKYFNIAGERGFTHAHIDLSYCYQQGIGVTKDEQMAKEERDLAVARLGEEEVAALCDVLDSMYDDAQPEQETLAVQDCSTDVCTICQNKIWSGQRASYLVCKHRFHSGCILRWLKGSLDNDDELGHTTCPVCRHNVLTDCVAE